MDGKEHGGLWGCTDLVSHPGPDSVQLCDPDLRFLIGESGDHNPPPHPPQLLVCLILFSRVLSTPSNDVPCIPPLLGTTFVQATIISLLVACQNLLPGFLIPLLLP